jgi:hypothetical protein
MERKGDVSTVDQMGDEFAIQAFRSSLIRGVAKTNSQRHSNLV